MSEIKNVKRVANKTKVMGLVWQILRYFFLKFETGNANSLIGKYKASNISE